MIPTVNLTYASTSSQTLNPISSIVQSALTAGFHFLKSVTSMLYLFASSGHPSPFSTRCHFLHCGATPSWTGVGVAFTPSAFEGELVTGVAVTFVGVMFMAVLGWVGVGAVGVVLSGLRSLFLALLVEPLPSLMQYRPLRRSRRVL